MLNNPVSYFLFKMAEVEESLNQIQNQKGVQEIMVTTSEDLPSKMTLERTNNIQYDGTAADEARSNIWYIEPQNDPTSLLQEEWNHDPPR